MVKKVLVVTGDGGEGYEALYAIHRFQEAGYEPVVAAPKKRRLHMVMHDFEEGWDTYVERPGYGVEAQIALREARVDDYEAVVILGGRAPEYLRNDPQVISMVKEFHAKKKWLFAICHGIQVLVSAGLARNARMTSYEHIRFEIESNGGTFVPEQAVRDGRIVTAQTWMSHPDFYREVFRCLEG